jgi:7-carboxy-7-deazaguanine synthase
MGRMHWGNLDHLTPRDEVKFVLCDAADYAWARQIVREHRLHERAAVLFSPVWGRIEARDLAEWILRDGLPVRMQMQLHKLLWGGEPGR